MREPLVAFLVSQEDECDVHFLEDFLLMFRTFMSPMELWTALTARFQQPVPSGQLASPILVATIRSKIVGVIFAWVRYYFNDFETDKALAIGLDRFVQTLQKDRLTAEYELLRGELDSIAYVPRHCLPLVLVPPDAHLLRLCSPLPPNTAHAPAASVLLLHMDTAMPIRPQAH